MMMPAQHTLAFHLICSVVLLMHMYFAGGDRALTGENGFTCQ